MGLFPLREASVCSQWKLTTFMHCVSSARIDILKQYKSLQLHARRDEWLHTVARRVSACLSGLLCFRCCRSCRGFSNIQELRAIFSQWWKDTKPKRRANFMKKAKPKWAEQGHLDTDDVSLQIEFHSLLVSLSNLAKEDCYHPFHFSLGRGVILLFGCF